MKFNVIWEGEPPEITEDQKLLLAREIVWLESSVLDPSDLVFHTIDLTSDPEGPCIIAFKKDGNQNDLFLEHYAESKFIPLYDDK
jgi:hypothetical protein